MPHPMKPDPMTVTFLIGWLSWVEDDEDMLRRPMLPIGCARHKRRIGTNVADIFYENTHFFNITHQLLAQINRPDRRRLSKCTAFTIGNNWYFQIYFIFLAIYIDQKRARVNRETRAERVKEVFKQTAAQNFHSLGNRFPIWHEIEFASSNKSHDGVTLWYVSE